MNIFKKDKVALISILILAFYLRCYQFTEFTPGVYLDEASMAYDAYSMGMGGVDQYGMVFPIYFRSFAMYQAPLYIYLSTVPTIIFGMNALSIRIVSLLAGMLTLILGYFLMRFVFPKFGSKIALIFVFILSISPWHILFSRNALEANLGLFVFVLSIFSLVKGVYKKNKGLIFFGLILLSFTNYAYHSYRFTSIVVALVLFPAFFLVKSDKSVRKVYFLGLVTFFILLIPQFMIFNTTGSLRRYELLQYTSDIYYQNNGSKYHVLPGGKYIFIATLFFSKYFDYLSPKSIFFDSDPSPTRSIPELSSFYMWMFLFYLIGIISIIRKYHNRVILFLIAIGLISIIPSAITVDNLHLLRALNYLFIVSIIVSIGLFQTLKFLKEKLSILLIMILIIISLTNFFVNYFYLSKHERKADYSGSINQLFEYTKKNVNNNFIISLSEPNAYGIALFTYKYNPEKFKKDIKLNLKNYYGDIPVPKSFYIDNLEIREIDWEKDVYEDLFLVGDERTLSSQKALDYSLELIIKFSTDLTLDNIAIYKTNPLKRCKKILDQKAKDQDLIHQCKEILKSS